MARERTPEGKRVVIPVRVSEPKAAAIDAARGSTPRSVWVEAAIDAALACEPASPLGIKVITDDRMPPGTIALVSRSREGISVAAARIKPEPCPHRLPVGAYCKTCEKAKT